MKRLIVIGMVLLFAGLLYSAATTVSLWTTNVGDVTIDSVYTGNWESPCSLIVYGQDTGYFRIQVHAVAYMSAFSQLYVGMGSDSGNRVDSATGATTGQTHTNLDTMIYRFDYMDRGTSYEYNWVPIYYEYITALIEPSDSLGDTFYVNMAVGTEQSKVDLKDVRVTATFHSDQAPN